TSTILHVVIEIFTKKPQGTKDRRARHIDESAESLPSIEIDELLELIEQSGIALPLLDAFEDGRQHRRLHPAGGTLAARFAREELSDSKRLLHHARPIGIETHDAATESRSCLL